MEKKVDTSIFFDEIKEIIKDVICPDEDKLEAITPETKISELVSGEFELCLLLEQVEVRNEIELKEEETILTVGDLCSLVQKNKTNFAQVDWQ